MAAKVEIILQGTDNASKPIRDVNQALTDVGEKGKGSFNILQNAASSALGFIGAQAGIAFAGMVTSAVSAGAEYGAVMNRIQAVSGATAGEMDLINKQALKLGADLPISAADAAQGMYALVTAGYSAKDAIAASGGVAALAASQQMEVGRASEIVSAALRGFGMEADQAGRVVDLLSQTASRSAVEVADVGETLKYVGPVAGSLKQPMEDISAAIALMGNSGVKGSMAGTALRTTLTNLVQPTDAAAAAMESLGIQITDGSQQVAKSSKEMEDDLKSWSKTTADAAQIPELKSALKELGYDYFPTTKKGAFDSAEAMKWLKNNLDNSTISVEEKTKAMAALGLEYTKESGQMLPLMDIMQQFRQKTAGMTDEQKASMAATLAGKEAMSGFLAILNASDADFNGMRDSMANAEGATDKFAQSMNKGLKFEIEQLKGSIETVLIQGFQAVEPVMVSVVSAITPVVNQIGEALPEAAGAVLGVIGDVIAVFQGTDMATDNLAESLSVLVPPELAFSLSLIIAAVSDLWGAFTDLISGDPSGALDAIGGAAYALAVAFGATSDQGNAVMETVISLARALLNSLGEAFDIIKPAVEDVAGAVGNLLTAAFASAQRIGEAFFTAIEPYMPAMQEAVGRLIEVWASLEAGALSTVAGFINGTLIPILSQLTDWIVANLPGAIDTLAGFIGGTLVPALQAVWDFLEGSVFPVLGTLATWLQETVPAAAETLKGVWGPIWEGIKTVVSDVMEGIRNILALWTAAREGDWRTFGETLRKIWNETWDNIKQAVTTLGGLVVEAVKTLISNVVNAWSQTDWGALGSAVIEGIKSGISSGLESLKNAAKRAAEAALEAAKGALGISSPSQVMADEVGAPIVQGIISGMQESTASLTAATMAVASAVVGGLSMTVPDAASIGAATTTAFTAGLTESAAAASLATTAESVASLAVTAMAPAAPVATQTGQSVMDGFASGLRSGGQAAIDTTREVIDEMAELMKTLATRMGASDMGIVEPGSNDADRIQGMSEAMGRIASGIKALVDTINLVTGESGRAAAEAINLTATREYFLWITSVLLDLSLIIATSAGAVENQISDTILGSLKRITDLLGPIKTAVTVTVGLVTTILEDVGGTKIETVFNDLASRNWVVSLVQGMVLWGEQIAEAVDDVQMQFDTKALPGLKALADFLSPITKAFNDTLSIIGMLNSEWRAPEDVGGGATRLTQIGVDVASAFLSLANAFDGKVTPAATEAVTALDMADKYIKDVYDLGKKMAQGLAQLPANYVDLTKQLVTLGKTISSTFIGEANNFDVVVGPGSEALLSVFTKLDKFYTGFGKSIQKLEEVESIPTDAGDRTRQIAVLAKDIGKAYLDTVNSFADVKGEGAVNLESTIGGFADLVKDTKELLKTWEDWGTKEVTGEDIAPALALFATIMTSLKSLSGIGGQQAGTTWGDEFKNGIQTSLEGWTPFPGGGEGGAAGDGATLGQFASGGSVNRTGRYLLHAGEVVMNPQQQARLAQNLVGGGGGGRGDTYSYTVNQTVYSVTGLEDTLNWLKVQGR